MIQSYKPKISFVIPVYNVEAYLPQCIESCLNQTLKDIEIILVDDGSPDNSGRICDEYSIIDNRIIVIHQSNQGLSSARNVGTKKAKAKYIMYLDSDDWIDRDTCEEVFGAVVEDQADIIMWGYRKEYPNKSVDIRLFENNRVFEGDSKKWLHRRLIGMLGHELRNPVKTDAYNSAWGKLYRKSIIEDYNIAFIDTKEVGSEDVLFNIEILWYAQKVIYINRLFNHYRQDNPNALTKNHKSSLFPRFLNLFSQIESFIKKKNLSEDYMQALANRIALSIINNALSISNNRNTERLKTKVFLINYILSHKIYREAIRKLDLKQFPFYWRLFFLTCKYQMGFLVYVEARIMLILK